MPTESHSDSSNRLSSQTNTNAHTNRLKVVEAKGDIFAAPSNSLLIHACNCEGSWGAGIAKAFKTHYPSAYQIYHAHCTSHDPEDLIGTALLIPTFRGDDADDDSTRTSTKSDRKTKTTTTGNKQLNSSEQQHKYQHFIGCLFTSRSKGAKKRDSPSQILEATGSAMRDLLEQVVKQQSDPKSTAGEDPSSSTSDNNEEEIGEGKKKEQTAQNSQAVEEIRMCKINSGLFNVPWEKTKAVIEGIEVPEVTTDRGGKSKAVVREIRCISRE
ncbi:hypothetical protein KC343_g13890 [Hortaea werneckii]|uniref:ADP-ribose 1''-phosphate phosphatase n=1 Tax=Hortaea werneckii TaxID=91943 RepID=A0A3M7ETM3_HORWE|nr:hypothetical protein KC352_g29458 [Hortaea werneckii]KAI7551548.1 hypothetical protein KC317_g13978 [Hortaea werneckii]KAI7596408.1 hypothetical protein KC346_g15166 [Hortaea werneckii]KAI7604968.1 hypothetical protein KC343_g13890 [Hortaea werneckii]KAI7641229.1 hypothetical protein KC319_g13595 [Hortaea werneckii]